MVEGKTAQDYIICDWYNQLIHAPLTISGGSSGMAKNSGLLARLAQNEIDSEDQLHMARVEVQTNLLTIVSTLRSSVCN